MASSISRRGFILGSGAGAIGVTTAAVSAAKATESIASGRPPVPSLKLGCQSGPSTAQHFAYLARYGVRNICASPHIDEPNRLYPTVGELIRLQELARRGGLSVDMTTGPLLGSTLIGEEKHPAIMLAESPERDRDIEAFQTLIVNCAKAGVPAVKYNMSILGVLRNTRVPGRGDAVYTGWDAAAASTDAPPTRAGRVTDEIFWERIDYFLERVVPVASENKVRLACHPHDPGVGATGFRGVNRVLGTVEGLKRFVALHESPYHGLNFCQGTIASDLARPAEEIFEVIRHFGQRRKIFNVHLRNIKGHRDKFVETFPDDGDVDMLRAVQTYSDVGYRGMLMPDHVPTVPTADPVRDYAYNYGEEGSAKDGHLESFAFAYGYIRGLIQAVERRT